MFNRTIKLCKLATNVRFLTYTRMSDAVKAGRGGFAGCSFTDALEKPLGFKISINNAATVLQFPDIFVLGMAEYQFNLDAFLALVSDTTNNSETTVASRDSLYLSVIKCVLPHCVVHQNQSVASSGNKQHSFAVSVSGALGMLGEQKLDSQDKAISQLMRTIYVPEFTNVLPAGQLSVPGIASTSDSLALYSVSLDGRSNAMVFEHIKSYSVNMLSERVEFTVDLFKLIMWLSAIAKPNKMGSLIPGAIVKTPNRHTVQLTKAGVTKQFERNRVSAATFGYMSTVYAAKRPNLESGWVMKTEDKVIIHTVGRPLHEAIESDTDLDGEKVAAMMEAGVAQLHELGYAHCDIALENFFVKSSGEVFLGDLEYLRPLDDPAPKTLLRSIVSATTAEELDYLQLANALDRLREKLATVYRE